MPTSDRHERHLMRQRGAGARSLLPSFGFKFSAPKPALKTSSSTPAKSKTPIRTVKSARRKSVIYRPPSARAKVGGSSPSSVRGIKSPVVPSEYDTQPLGLTPPPEPEREGVPSSPVRKAKFTEHLDEHEPVKEGKKKGARKRKTVTMPKRKRAVAKKVPLEEEGGEVGQGVGAGRKRAMPKVEEGSSKKARLQKSEMKAKDLQVPRRDEEEGKKGSLLSKLRSPSKVSLRSTAGSQHNASKAEPQPRARKEKDEEPDEIIIADKSPVKKVGRARRMFRVNDGDSGDESWFRRSKRK